MDARICDNRKKHAELDISVDGISASFISDKGGRSENQDSYAYVRAIDGTHVYCVADGLGGHAGGQLASQIAVETICNFVKSGEFRFDDPLSLHLAFEKVNDAIVEQQNQLREFSSMRSTLVVLLIKDSMAFWAHVGDVRLYLIRDHQIIYQSKDQSVPQMLVDTGEITSEEIRQHPDRSRLLQALGARDKAVRPGLPVTYMQLNRNDRFHLSTDGFWEWLTEEEMLAQILGSPDSRKLTGMMFQEVVNNARAIEPGFDNLTALNVLVSEAEQNKDFWHKTTLVVSE